MSNTRNGGGGAERRGRKEDVRGKSKQAVSEGSNAITQSSSCFSETRENEYIRKTKDK